jgi:hypothetical protein
MLSFLSLTVLDFGFWICDFGFCLSTLWIVDGRVAVQDASGMFDVLWAGASESSSVRSTLLKEIFLLNANDHHEICLQCGSSTSR